MSGYTFIYLLCFPQIVKETGYKETDRDREQVKESQRSIERTAIWL